MPDKNELATHHYNLGIQYEKENNIAGARAEFERSVQADPGFPYPYKALGEIQYREGELEAALKSLEAAYRLDPEWLDLTELLAQVLFQLGQKDRAIELQQKLLRKDSDNIGHKTMLGKMLVSAGRYAEAVTLLEDTSKIDPANFLAHYNLGVAYGKRAMQDMDSSILHWRRARELAPDDAVVCRNLGIALFSRGLLPEAAGAFKAALDLDPGDTVAARFIRFAENADNFG